MCTIKDMYGTFFLHMIYDCTKAKKNIINALCVSLWVLREKTTMVTIIKYVSKKTGLFWLSCVSSERYIWLVIYIKNSCFKNLSQNNSLYVFLDNLESVDSPYICRFNTCFVHGGHLNHVYYKSDDLLVTQKKLTWNLH